MISPTGAELDASVAALSHGFFVPAKEISDAITALRTVTAETRAAMERVHKNVDTVSAEMLALRTERDALRAQVAEAEKRGRIAGLEEAAAFCRNNCVGLEPAKGFVVSAWTPEIGGKHPGMAYADALIAQAKGETK